MNMQVLDARRDAGGGYRVVVNRGERVGRVNLCHPNRLISVSVIATKSFDRMPFSSSALRSSRSLQPGASAGSTASPGRRSEWLPWSGSRRRAASI
jgi:hypothetical protein